MTDSLSLSLFFWLFLVLEIFVYKKSEFSFLKKGKELKLSRKKVIIIFLIVAIISLVFSLIILYKNTSAILQIFYIILYGLSLILTLVFLLPIPKVYLRILVAILISSALLILTLACPYQLLRNFFMASALLWVGPALFKKLQLSLKPFIAIIVLLTLFDIYNVCLAQPIGAFSDKKILLNSVINFGNFDLGAGDFFLGYLLIASVLKNFKTFYAIILTVFLALPNFLIYFVFPKSIDIVIPYYIFMVPITLFIYWISWQSSHKPSPNP